MNSLEQTYHRRYGEILAPIAALLQPLLSSHLRGVPRIDRIAVRPKSMESFLKKAAKERDGVRAYSDPLEEVQDQIGARVIVFFTSDIEPACASILRYCRHIEELTKEPQSEAEFGYFGRHYILAMPADAVPKDVDLRAGPKVFELQVRTLFQHAWSEAEHDLAYKPQRELTPDKKRKFAFTAAQAWGADRIFQDLFDSLI